MSQIKKITNEELQDRAQRGQNKKATTLKMSQSLLMEINDIAAEEGSHGAKIRLIESSIRNGIFYSDYLRKRVNEYLRVNRPLRDEYVDRYEQKSGHTSYVDSSPIYIDDYIATSFIIDAIDEKIDREDEKARSVVEEDADPAIYGMKPELFESWMSKGWREAFEVDSNGIAQIPEAHRGKP